MCPQHILMHKKRASFKRLTLDWKNKKVWPIKISIMLIYKDKQKKQKNKWNEKAKKIEVGLEIDVKVEICYCSNSSVEKTSILKINNHEYYSHI
jgi:hypothetical protein